MMTGTSYPCTIKGDRLPQRGVDFGYGDRTPRLIKLGKRHAVIKCPGGSDWSCRGASCYTPSAWYLVKCKVKGDQMVITEIIRREEPGRYWSNVSISLIVELEQREKKLNSATAITVPHL